jgi:gamma-glutamylcyclotransferase (GGCT)/AIG2-like uncharacterized protein YtfP
MSDTGASALFAYGTLLVPEIALAVIGRLPPSRPAHLNGFARYLVTHEVYPGLVREAGASVAGKLYIDLEERDWIRLDEYEGELYERCSVEVKLGQPQEVTTAQCYVVPTRSAAVLSTEPWELGHFVAHHRSGFGVSWE